MLSLAVFYAAEDAPFLAFVQVIVYTGAVMMLFLFVLMLIGVDTSRLLGRDDPRAAARGRCRRPASLLSLVRQAAITAVPGVGWPTTHRRPG